MRLRWGTWPDGGPGGNRRRAGPCGSDTMIPAGGGDATASPPPARMRAAYRRTRTVTFFTAETLPAASFARYDTVVVPTRVIFALVPVFQAPLPTRYCTSADTGLGVGRREAHSGRAALNRLRGLGAHRRLGHVEAEDGAVAADRPRVSGVDDLEVVEHVAAAHASVAPAGAAVGGLEDLPGVGRGPALLRVQEPDGRDRRGRPRRLRHPGCAAVGRCAR